ncbi:MAG TPA: hypothetical protein VJ946_06915, partial [Bacteroidales bacterium]|nr:hypothetical protein [Bacteroidales bacterium]
CMRIFGLLSLFIVFSGCLMAQEQQNEFMIDSNTVKCHSSDGRLHGEYNAYYENGQKRVSGLFAYGQRTGEWKVWDENGNLAESRKYTNNLMYQPSGESGRNPAMKYKRNADGVYPYRSVSESDVLFYKPVVSVILPDDNPYLFNGEPFLRLMKSNCEAQDFDIVNVYDKFQKVSSDISFENKKIIGFKLMQEFVYDSSRHMMEPRILYIAPVLLDVITEKLHHDLWYDFQAIYPAMADISVEVPGFSPEITNLADLFYWQAYTYRFIGIGDQDQWSGLLSDIPENAFADKSTMNALVKNSLKKRVRILEAEHDLWKSAQ